LEQKSEVKTIKYNSDILKNTIIESIEDKKGEGITIIDLKNVGDAIADYFIICEADNKPQVRAIGENIAYHVKTELAEMPLSIEGMQNLEWVLVDFFDIVVHVFYHEKRAFYNIEELWSDGNIEHL